MLTDETAQSFASICDVLIKDSVEHFNHLAGEAQFEMMVSGTSYSTAHIQILDLRAGEVIRSTAQAMYGELVRVHGAEPATNSVARTDHLRTLFSDRLDVLGQALIAARDKRVSNASRPEMPTMALPAASAALEKAQQEYRARIHIDVTSIANTGHASMTVHNTTTIHGPVGAVQSGTNSTANVSQTVLTPPNTAAVKAALDTLIEALSVARHMPENQRLEAIEVLHDVKIESDKAAPNKLKLGGLLSGANSVLEMIPNATAAWEVVKAWIGRLGA
jgi:flagellar hook-basal body complex protein FliE